MTNDTISRKEVIDIVENSYYNLAESAEDVDSMIEDVEALPSADRPIGEWVDNGDRYYRCSLCGTKDTDTWDWCHGCGCRMKGADDE